MSASGETTDAEREQRRQAASTHGAMSYLNRTDQGQGITAAMALVESRVIAEVDRDGPRARVEKQANRLGTAADLLWQHMQATPEAFESLLPKWGWLVGAEIRARLAAATMASGTDDVTAGRVLESLKREQD